VLSGVPIGRKAAPVLKFLNSGVSGVFFVMGWNAAPSRASPTGKHPAAGALQLMGARLGEPVESRLETRANACAPTDSDSAKCWFFKHFPRIDP
jgi:hypothetical protein